VDPDPEHCLRGSSVADPHHFDADFDPGFHFETDPNFYFDADSDLYPDPAFNQAK
jgi:hypothetical protein